MGTKKETMLFEVNREVLCRQCGNKGAVCATAVQKTSYSIDPLLFIGGTPAWECLNCGAKGLVGLKGESYKLEGLNVMFDMIPPTFQEGQKVFHKGLKKEGTFLQLVEGDSENAVVIIAETDGSMKEEVWSLYLLATEFPKKVKAKEADLSINGMNIHIKRINSYGRYEIHSQDGKIDAKTTASGTIVGKGCKTYKNEILTAVEMLEQTEVFQ